MEAENSKRETKRLGNALASVRAEVRQLRAVVTELQRDLDDVRSQRQSNSEKRGISNGSEDGDYDRDISELGDFDNAVDEDDSDEQ